MGVLVHFAPRANRGTRGSLLAALGNGFIPRESPCLALTSLARASPGGPRRSECTMTWVGSMAGSMGGRRDRIDQRQDESRYWFERLERPLVVAPVGARTLTPGLEPDPPPEELARSREARLGSDRFPASPRDRSRSFWPSFSTRIAASMRVSFLAILPALDHNGSRVRIPHAYGGGSSPGSAPQTSARSGWSVSVSSGKGFVGRSGKAARVPARAATSQLVAVNVAETGTPRRP